MYQKPSAKWTCDICSVSLKRFILCHSIPCWSVVILSPHIFFLRNLPPTTYHTFWQSIPSQYHRCNSKQILDRIELCIPISYHPLSNGNYLHSFSSSLAQAVRKCMYVCMYVLSIYLSIYSSICLSVSFPFLCLYQLNTWYYYTSMESRDDLINKY